jgi:signal transduction histidine kinase
LVFNSLKVKTLIWFTGILFTLFFIFSFLIYYSIEESINLKIQNNLYYSARDILDELEENKLDKITFKYEKAHSIEAAIIKDNKIIKKTLHFNIDNFNNYINKKQIFFTKESGKHTINIIYILNFDKPFSGAILLQKRGLPNKAENIRNILLILNPIFLFILIIVGNRLIDKILIPIQNLTSLARKININNLTEELKVNQKEIEIQELKNTFNDMIFRLRDGIEKIDRFNNDVSHELRTPLTVINTQIELANKKDREVKYYKNSLNKISNETQKIEKIVEDMLILTKYTKENIKDTFSLCDINSILIDNIEKFTIIANQKNISINIIKFEKSISNINYSLIHILFSNLIDNAIKYSNENTTISISLFTKNNKINFIIQDEGIGIPKESIDKITDRFYRVEQSRNKNTKGFGLGLSLVQNIIQLHNGILNIESEKSSGTKITTIF